MPTLKELYNKDYAEYILSNKSEDEYLSYLKDIIGKVDNASDFNNLSRNIATLENSIHKRNNILSAHSNDRDYLKSYNLVNAIDNGHVIKAGDDGYDEFNKYVQEVDKLGSELDDDGNISRRASKLMFAFDTDYDYNNFLEHIGYNQAQLSNNGIEYAKYKGKNTITIDKGNSLFAKVLIGVNSIDDMSDSSGWLEWLGKTVSRPFKRAYRAYESTGDGFLNKVRGLVGGAGTFLISTAGVGIPLPPVKMFGIDDSGIFISNKNEDSSNFIDYKALGDYALADYKNAKSYIDSFETGDGLAPQKIHILDYLTANEAEARKFLNDTQDYTTYNAWLAEEYRRAGRAIQTENLADYEVFMDDEGNGIVRQIPADEIYKIQRLLRNAISEDATGSAEDKGKRVKYNAAYNDNGDVGCYITIADKADDGSLTSNFDYNNTLAGRTIFVKGLLTKELEEAINRDTKSRANREALQMEKYGYDFHLNNGGKILKPSIYGATYVTPERETININGAGIRAILNEQYATEDAINYFKMMQNAEEAAKSAPELDSSLKEQIYRMASGITQDSYKDMPTADKITKANSIYTTICRSLGIKVD